MLSAEAVRRPLPDSETLMRHVLPLVARSDAAGVALVARQANAGASHYASEVVTVGWPDGRSLRLLLKYDDGEDTMACGLTVGPAYEALVYEQVLPRFAVTVPKCYGTWRNPDTGTIVMVLQHLDGVHANRAPDQVDAMSLAAGWIGRMHALAEPAVAERTLPTLNVYDADLYRYWAARTRDFERRTRAGRTWLPVLLDRIDAAFDVLRGARQTVIHGDYYPDNMVYQDGSIAVFDWEQTALAPGEIDLASLTHGWHDEVVQAAEHAYRRARWPEGAPATFSETLEAARIFVLLRLLGEARGWPSRPTRRWRVDLLRQSAERLGLI